MKSNPAVDHIQNELWDIVVVGTGMGGATIGHSLAQRGFKVLFLEKGPLLHPLGSRDSVPNEVDICADPPPAADVPGRWPHKLSVRTNFGDAIIAAPLGCGSGGSTTCYGAVLERMTADDFQPGEHFKSVKTGSSSVDAWPITHAELLPYYRLAERIYRVRGTPDPLFEAPDEAFIAPPAATQTDEALIRHLKASGLNPYRLHVASEFNPACEQCLGYCDKNCRNDAGKICLMPAIHDGNAELLHNCTVVKLTAEVDRVTSAVCQYREAMISIRGRIFVLAAGAYASPVILLNSASAVWPDGVANRSGLVGKNLMMHTMDFFAVWPKGAEGKGQLARTVGFKDFYLTETAKLGMIQSSGVRVNWGLVLRFLRDFVDSEGLWWGRIVRPALPVIAWIGFVVFRRATVLATVLEDLPYEQNCVVPDSSAPGGFRIEYEYTEELKTRNRILRDKIRERLGPWVAFLLERQNNLNFGHPCGTCRFGDDPSVSVLDRNNKAHGINNLYVVDASFFPSSSGVNPSLTIAANAMRVADHIAAELAHSSAGP